MTPGMTRKEIGERAIAKGFGRLSVLAEWSGMHCDYYELYLLFQFAGLDHHMPPKYRSWLITTDWLAALKGTETVLNCSLSCEEEATAGYAQQEHGKTLTWEERLNLIGTGEVTPEAQAAFTEHPERYIITEQDLNS